MLIDTENIVMHLRCLLFCVMSFVALPSKAQDSLAELIAQGYYEPALQITTSALRSSDHPDLHLMRGYALLGLGDAEAATSAAKAAQGTEQAFHLNLLRAHSAKALGRMNIAGIWYRRAYDAAEFGHQKAAIPHFMSAIRAERRWIWDAQFSFVRP